METLSIPEGLDFIPSPPGGTIRKVWRSWQLLPLAFFACLWDSFLVRFYRQILSQPHPNPVLVLFPTIHLAVGVGLSYFVFASLFNKTDILISPDGLRVATGPMPWIGNVSIARSEIRAVKVRERVSSKGRVSRAIVYVDPSGKEKSFGSSAYQSDQAEYICRVIRPTLGLRADQ